MKDYALFIYNIYTFSPCSGLVWSEFLCRQPQSKIRSKSRVANHHRGHRLAPLLCSVGTFGRETERGTESYPRPTAESQHQHRTVQTRIRATTIYPSQYEPWDGCLSGFPGKSPGYDALQFAIDECHKRGMEVHAWVVTIPVGKWNSYGCRQLRKRFPRLIKRIDQDGYMDPEATQTCCYLAEMCREIVQRYDVDGIHSTTYAIPRPGSSE